MRTILLNPAVLFSLLFSIAKIQAQQPLSELNIKLQSIEDNTKQAYSFRNPHTGGFNLVLTDYNNVYLTEFDTNGQKIKEYVAKKKTPSHVRILGCIPEDGQSRIILSNASGSSISCIETGSNGTRITPFNFKTGKEKYLQSFFNHSDFYIVSIQKYSSVLTFYKLLPNGSFNPHTVDLSRYRFSNTSRNKLYTVIRDSANESEMVRISKIKQELPNSYDDIINGSKIYTGNDKLIISLDQSIHQTILIQINLIDYSFTVNSFPQPNTVSTDYLTFTNSFFYDGYLYQAKFCNDEIHFMVYNVETREVKSRHLVNAQNFNDFRNTTIKRTGIGEEKLTHNSITIKLPDKELDSAKVKIRKIAKGQPGISVTSDSGHKIVSIGGTGEFNMYFKGPLSNLSLSDGFVLSSNYFMFVKLLLDENFNRISGEIAETVFDEMHEYFKTKKMKEVARTILPCENHYILGYYDKENARYVLLKFEK